MSESEKPDTVAPEQLTEEERALIAEYPWPRTPQAAAHEKILRIHDALLARVQELEAQLAARAR